METIKEKLNNGNIIEYKIINETAYHADTDKKVIDILENTRMSNQRIRLFYGDIKTGRDWMEEYDTIGYIGRSTGKIKIPLLVKTNKSYGGGAILDDCIVKITLDKKIIYQHPKYHLPKINILDAVESLIKDGYKTSVFAGNKNIANFRKSFQAYHYKDFLKGNRNRI
ncbi:hypothetical protein ACFHWD_03830 [Clostridium sp. MT-14]|uniref:hypothetical protein n=1 Tax=Clostridium sp. MT-14 TaxID=3348360 RepID=UPI0035F4B557